MTLNFNDNRITNWTIFFSLLIIIGAGHGIGLIGFIELMTIFQLVIGELELNLSGNYDQRLLTVGLIFLVCQLVLITSNFINSPIKRILRILATIILLIGAYIWHSGLDYKFEFFHYSSIYWWNRDIPKSATPHTASTLATMIVLRQF